MTQHEIVDESGLLNSDGEIIQAGWARRPLLDCNLENARFYRLRWLQRFRVKRWDYYGATYPGGYFSATIADLGYAGQVFVYLVDFERGGYVEDTITIPFSRGVSLPRNSTSGRSEWHGKRAHLVFDAASGQRTVAVNWDDFGGRQLTADLSFAIAPDHESTVITIPIEQRRFYYNRKINCIPVGGTVTVGGNTTILDPATSSGTLDWGRGVWAYNSFWVWASASGFLTDGHRVGLNLGYGFGDTSAATENTLYLGGRIHKLDDITFGYDNTNFMRSWQMQSDRVQLTFTPFLERTARTNLLLIRSEVHQMFGHYTGTVVDDAGNDVSIDGLVGWAEEHQARW